MANHLVNETSPYLQQHQDNPVNWYPWNQSALNLARKENKPIFLSIGYSACHWCHVMAHESFENIQTAQVLNDHFINIKVDREERPDLDDIYMEAVVLLAGQGGWPLSVFLNPDLKPFYGGTYFPPESRYGMPSFTHVLNAIITAWNDQPASIFKNAEVLTNAILSNQTHQGESSPTPDLDAIVTRLHSTYDWQSGGWGNAPRFPQPMLIDFLIQRGLKGDAQATEMVTHLLEHMSRGGMYDLVGGGFHRYSTDANWLVPHFEKMLYDNAQLALTYLHGFALSGNGFFKQVVEQTLDYLQTEMLSPDGVFYTSMDADTPAGEGRYYAWHINELQDLLSPDEFSSLQKMTGISKQGNFETGLNIIQRVDNAFKEEGSAHYLDRILTKLKTARAQRIPPEKDRKIITEWNAMAIRAFAEAGLALDRADYLTIAENAIRFILDHLTTSEGTLYRSWRNGKANQPGTLADYTALISALYSVYAIDFDPSIYLEIQTMFHHLQANFNSQDALYFDSAANLADLVVRPRNIQDNATPSGNAMAAYAHWLIGNLEQNPQHIDRTSQMVHQVGMNLNNHPTSFGYWLQVAGLLATDAQQIALISPDDGRKLQPFLEIYRSAYRPFSVIAAMHAGTQTSPKYPSILADRPVIEDKATAYICQGFVCQRPVTDPNLFRHQVDQSPQATYRLEYLYN